MKNDIRKTRLWWYRYGLGWVKHAYLSSWEHRSNCICRPLPSSRPVRVPSPDIDDLFSTMVNCQSSAFSLVSRSKIRTENSWLNSDEVKIFTWKPRQLFWTFYQNILSRCQKHLGRTGSRKCRGSWSDRSRIGPSKSCLRKVRTYAARIGSLMFLECFDDTISRKKWVEKIGVLSRD